MKVLRIKSVIKNHAVRMAGCGKNWDNLCGSRE